MSYSDNHNVEATVLAVINDGNGSVCGLNYRQRCDLSENGLVDYRLACRKASPTLTRREIIETANHVQDYYREHVKELARYAKEGA